MLEPEKKNTFPVSVVFCSEQIEGAALLCDPRPLQIGFSKENILHFGSGTLILDFGSASLGGIRLLIRDCPKDGSIRITLAETLDEVSADHVGEGAFTVPTTIYSDMTYRNTVFRYARIDFSAGDSEYGVAAIVRRHYGEDRFTPPEEE